MMEEVDRIIIHSLKDIGCDLEDNLESLEEFTADMVVDAAVRCLEIIQPGTDLPRTLPQNVAARFHLGSAIAEACKTLGYNGDVGYQTFLYSNVVDVRRVFMFLIEKLPRETEKITYEPEDPLSKLKAKIANEIKHQLSIRSAPSESSLPFISCKLETGIIGPTTKIAVSPKEWRDYVINDLPVVTDQVPSTRLLPSLISLNSQGLCKSYGSRSKEVTPSSSVNDFREVAAQQSTSHDSWLSVNQSIFFSRDLKTPDRSSQNLERTSSSIDVPLSNLDINNDGSEISGGSEPNIDSVKSNIDYLQAKTRETLSIITQVAEDYKREMKIAQKRSDETALHDRALAMLPDSERNLLDLEKSVSTLSERILVLARKWESYRKPLLEKYTAARSKMTNKESQNVEEHEKIMHLKSKIDSIQNQFIAKRSLISQLQEEYEKLPKNINRSAYTRRIMEIIGNISKQNDQIEKILTDTKDLQKEINTLNGRLERLFAVTEETIYRNAKKDEFSKRSFKLLATLHSDCATIGSLVLEIGTITREITDLKEQIEVESRKNTTANLERITADLDQMRMESKSLKSQINKFQSATPDIPSHPLL